jgi:hypothetical protein
VIIATEKPAVPTFQPRPSKDGTYFGTRELTAPYERSNTTFVIAAGSEPLSYIIPDFSPDNRFIRLSGDLPVEPGTPLGEIAHEAIARSSGPVKAITNIPITDSDRITLSKFGLSLAGKCAVSDTVVHTVHVCDLDRVPSSDKTAAAPLQLNATIDFRRNGNGWIYEDNPDCWSDWLEDWGTWATGGISDCSSLDLRLQANVQNDLTLTAMTRGFVPDATKPQQVAVFMNDKEIGVWTFSDSNASLRRLVIPKSSIAPESNYLRFSNPNAISRNDAGVQLGDNRKLAVGFEWLKIGD